jgi:hypothetical protein
LYFFYVNMILRLRSMSHTIYAAKFEQTIIHQHVHLRRKSQSHAPAHVPMRLYRIDINRSFVFHWQHQLCATFSPNVYYRICTLRHIRIEINHRSQNVFYHGLADISKCYPSLLVNMYIYDGKVSHMLRRMCQWDYTESI